MDNVLHYALLTTDVVNVAFSVHTVGLSVRFCQTAHRNLIRFPSDNNQRGNKVVKKVLVLADGGRIVAKQTAFFLALCRQADIKLTAD